MRCLTSLPALDLHCLDGWECGCLKICLGVGPGDAEALADGFVFDFGYGCFHVGFATYKL